MSASRFRPAAAATCRRLLVAVAVLAALAPGRAAAQAAAPEPAVTVTGLIDNLGTFSRNLSAFDANLNRNRDSQFFGRTRGRFEIIGQIGQAKAVVGFEIDSTWGQIGRVSDSNVGPGCIEPFGGALQCGAVAANSESDFRLNTDTQGALQVNWLYTEFPLPLLPFPAVARLGAQPFSSAATYKLGVYAYGDFPGVNLAATFSPRVRLQVTYVALDESLTGKGGPPVLPFSSTTGFSSSTPAKCISAGGGVVVGGAAATPSNTLVPCQPQASGDNFAVIVSPELAVARGFDVKPMYSYVFINGLTARDVRQGRGGVPVVTSQGQESAFAPSVVGIGGADGSGTGVHEQRHTIGIDARYRSGPWMLDPTVLYQWGSQGKWILETVPEFQADGPANTRRTADISAWLVDVRGGYQWGAWLFQSMVLYTTGNPAKVSPFRKINYFQPLSTENAYGSDWGTQIFSQGLDDNTVLNGVAANWGLSPATAIGYDKYGRIQLGVKASVSLTDELTIGAGIAPNWTDTKVDTDSQLILNGGLRPSFVCRKTLRSCRPEGDSNYLGTEFDVAITYRMAPGLWFDWAAGYLQAGNALGHRYLDSPYNAGAGAPVRKDIGVQDAGITVARVRFSF